MNWIRPFLPPNPIYLRPCGVAGAERIKRQFPIRGALPVIFALFAGLISVPQARAQTPTEGGIVDPTGTYEFRLTAGWSHAMGRTKNGNLILVSTPGAVPDLDGGKGGIWIHALPVPNDEQLESEDRRRGFANRFLRMVHPGDALDPDSVRETKLAGADALAWSLSTESDGASGRQGEVRLAVLRDTVLAVEISGLASSWPDLADDLDGLLGGLRLLPPAWKAAVPPAQPELASSVAARFKGSVPQVWADARESDSLAGGAPTDPHELVPYSTGTGFVVSTEGYVVTNRHVVARGGDDSTTRFLFDPVWLKWDPLLHRGWEVADVVAVSRQWDLALLKIRDEGPWTPMPLADLDLVAEAQQVLVMGWPAADGKETELLHHNWNVIASVERDSKMRPRVIRHGARTTSGNSGGPVYDLELGGIIGVHSRGYVSTAHDFDDMFQHGAVPADRILWEFPQIFSESEEGLSPESRVDRIVHFFQQERFGAATLECRRLLEEDADNGTAHAYLLRMLQLQGEPLYAATHFDPAVADPSSRVRAHLFAARSALEEGDMAVLGKQAALAKSSAREMGKETPKRL